MSGIELSSYRVCWRAQVRYRVALAPLAAEVLPEAVARTHSALGRNWDWSGVAAAPTTARGHAAAASHGNIVMNGGPLSNGGIAGGLRLLQRGQVGVVSCIEMPRRTHPSRALS